MKNKLFSIIAFLLVTFATSLNAQDWPQFLGPERNSTSPEKGILRSWPETGPEVLWTASIGIGYGGPVVKDGKVYLLDRDDNVGDNMRCFNLSDGKELWNFSYESPGSVPFSGSRSVPVVEGNYVYSCGLNGDLYCIDINTHSPVWNKNVWTDFDGDRIPMFGISQCPLIHGDLLILASQAPEAGVVAYEKSTGIVKWSTPSIGPVGNVSPNIIKIDGVDHVVMVTASLKNGNGKVVGIDPLNGKILWEYANWQCEYPVPCAIDAGNNKVLVTGGYDLGALMLEVKKQADGSYVTTEVFRTVEFGDHTKPPLLIDGYFYAQYSTNDRRDGLMCMSMDGQIMWKTGREPGFDKGSMIVVDGLILASDGAKNLYLIKPDTTGFKPLAKAEVLGTKGSTEENPMPGRIGGSIQNWAPMALSDGRLLVRDKSRLMCVKVTQ
jgi:outer membrane protein assembly factor BamB